MTHKVSVLVAGSWGTALASVLADNGKEVLLWSRNEEQVVEINEKHTNSRFLKDISLSPSIIATHSLLEAVQDADAIIMVVPSSGMREVASRIRPFLKKDTLIIHATKGFETGTLKRMTEVLADELPEMDPKRFVVLSGQVMQKKLFAKCRQPSLSQQRI